MKPSADYRVLGQRRIVHNKSTPLSCRFAAPCHADQGKVRPYGVGPYMALSREMRRRNFFWINVGMIGAMKEHLASLKEDVAWHRGRK